MVNKTKRLMAVLLCAVMALAVVPAFAAGEAGVQVGDYLRMGIYYGDPILWRCVAIDENGPLMLADRIICLKPFDAYVSVNNAGNSHSRRFTWQSNYWGDSTLRSWLNSSAPAGSVQWLCGNPPSQDYVWYNNYENEAGFLTSFTDSELAAVKEVNQKYIVSVSDYTVGVYDTGSVPSKDNGTLAEGLGNYDSAYAAYASDKIFVPDLKQLVAVYNNSAVLGDGYYMTTPTAQCVANSQYKDNILSNSINWYYWIRSAGENSDNDVRNIEPNGSIYASDADDGDVGVRPAFYLADNAAIASGTGAKDAPYMIAGAGIAVTVNSTPVQFDVAPLAVNGSTMLPIRMALEPLGAQFTWNGDNQTVTIQAEDKTIVVTLGSTVATVNGAEKTMTEPAMSINGRVLIPIRFVAEEIGYNVDWDGATNTVVISNVK